MKVEVLDNRQRLPQTKLKLKFMKNLAQDLLIILACVGMITLLVWQTFEAMNKQDEIDCNKWVQEAKEYKGTYYITKLQKEQCDTYGVNIDAPVK